MPGQKRSLPYSDIKISDKIAKTTVFSSEGHSIRTLVNTFDLSPTLKPTNDPQATKDTFAMPGEIFRFRQPKMSQLEDPIPQTESNMESKHFNLHPGLDKCCPMEFSFEINKSDTSSSRGRSLLEQIVSYSKQPFPFLNLLPELQVIVLTFLSKRDLLLLRFTSKDIRELVDTHAPFMYIPMAGMLSILQMKSIAKYQQLTNYELIKCASKYFKERKFPGKMGFQLNELGPFDVRSARAIPEELYLLRIQHCRLEEGVLSYLPKMLNSLILNYCVVKDQDLQFLPPGIKRLALGECKDITDEAVRFIPHGIQRLTLTGCEKLTNEALKSLPRNLRVLDFTGSPHITDDGIKDLPQTLKRLSLTSCSAITSNSFKLLPKGLEYFEVIHTKVKIDEDFKNLPPSIREMRFCSCNAISKNSVQYIPKAMNRLSLIHCNDLNLEVMKGLPTSLEFLSLYGCATDELLTALPPSLTELDLSECQRITDNGLKNLPPNLKKLYMRHTPITNEGLKLLPCKNLEELDLGSCSAINDQGLTLLPSSLIYVNLWGNNEITPNGVQNFHAVHSTCSTNVAYSVMKELLTERYGS